MRWKFHTAWTKRKRMATQSYPFPVNKIKKLLFGWCAEIYRIIEVFRTGHSKKHFDLISPSRFWENYAKEEPIKKFSNKGCTWHIDYYSFEIEVPLNFSNSQKWKSHLRLFSKVTRTYYIFHWMSETGSSKNFWKIEIIESIWNLLTVRLDISNFLFHVWNLCEAGHFK